MEINKEISYFCLDTKKEAIKTLRELVPDINTIKRLL